MLNRAEMQKLERQSRERDIAQGRSKFVRRKFGFGVAFFAIVMTGLYFTNGRTRPALFACLAVFLVGVVGAYLEAIWKWSDLIRRNRS